MKMAEINYLCVHKQLRQKKLKDISRWAKFRVERQEVIDRYIKVRKKQYKAEMLIKLLTQRNYVQM